MTVPWSRVLTPVVAAALAFGVGWWARPEATVAIEAVEHIAGRVVPAAPVELKDAPWRAQVLALQATAEAGSARASALLSIRDAPTRAATARAIASLGPVSTRDDVPLLVSMSNDGNFELRDAAVVALGLNASDAAVKHLIDVAEHRLEHRPNAIIALGRSGHRDALAWLTREFDRGAYVEVAPALATMGTPEARDALVTALYKTYDWNAYPLASALASFADSDPKARAALYDIAKSGNPQRREAAFNALADIRDPGLFDVLAKAAQKGNYAERDVAIRTMGLLKDDRAVPILVKLTAGVEMRSVAISALSAMHIAESQAALIQLITEGNSSVALDVIWQISPVDDPDVTATLIEVTQTRSRALKNAAFGRLFDHSWDPRRIPKGLVQSALEEAVGTQSPDAAIRFLLRSAGPQGWQALESLAVDGSFRSRNALVQNLYSEYSPQAEGILLLLARDHSADVRDGAFDALVGRSSNVDLQVVNLALEALEERDNGSGRIEYLLARVGTPVAVDALLDRARNGTTEEQSRAIEALSTGSPEVAARLAELLDDTDDPNQKELLWSRLVNQGNPDPAVLENALLEESASIRSQAVASLARSGMPDAEELLREHMEDEDPMVRDAALRGLVELSPNGVEDTLIGALDDPDLASSAIYGLHDLGTKGATDALVGVVRSDDQDTSVRRAALDQLVYDDHPESVNLLKGFLSDDDPELRSGAIDGLAQLGTTDAARELLSVMRNTDDETEAWRAAQALQGMGGRVADDNLDEINSIVEVPPEGLEQYPNFYPEPDMPWEGGDIY